MSRLQRVLFEQVIVQQVRLYACLARLREQTDAEALHDLRITLRRLRSLLRPLRREPLCAAVLARCVMPSSSCSSIVSTWCTTLRPIGKEGFTSMARTQRGSVSPVSTSGRHHLS